MTWCEYPFLIQYRIHFIVMKSSLLLYREIQQKYIRDVTLSERPSSLVNFIMDPHSGPEFLVVWQVGMSVLTSSFKNGLKEEERATFYIEFPFQEKLTVFLSSIILINFTSLSNLDIFIFQVFINNHFLAMLIRQR